MLMSATHQLSSRTKTGNWEQMGASTSPDRRVCNGSRFGAGATWVGVTAEQFIARLDAACIPFPSSGWSQMSAGEQRYSVQTTRIWASSFFLHNSKGLLSVITPTFWKTFCFCNPPPPPPSSPTLFSTWAQSHRSMWKCCWRGVICTRLGAKFLVKVVNFFRLIASKNEITK